MLSYSNDLQTINTYSRDTFFSLHADGFSCTIRALVLLCKRAETTPDHCQPETSTFHLRFLWQCDPGNTLLPGNKW